MSLRPYQVKAMRELEEKLQINPVVVLAACPSAGKTFMLTHYVKQNPDKRILILPHGTTVLNTQWAKALTEQGIKFGTSPESKVCLQLPQSLHKKDLKPFDLIVVDEAHEFYDAAMVKTIIAKAQPKKQILLTGTPSIFVAKGLPLVAVSAAELIGEGFISDLYFGVATTTEDIKLSDYSSDKDLRGDFQFKKTSPTLDRLLKAIEQRLKSRVSKSSPNLNKALRWASAIGGLGKTLIACHNIQQAKQVEQYFHKNKVGVALSTTDNDADSENIEAFRTNPNVNVLVVVRRAVLGFNMEELVNVVDLTCSLNINRIYQLYARVMRVCPSVPNKYFFKICQEMDQPITKFYLSAAINMMFPEFFTQYNGKNLSGMRIMVKRVKEKTKAKSDRSRKSSASKETILPIDELFESQVSAYAIMKDLFNKADDVFNEYAYATMSDVEYEYGKRANEIWSLEKCKNRALNYKHRGEWRKIDNASYEAARRNGWIEICSKHMVLLYKRKTKEECLGDALKYSSRWEWGRKSHKFYQCALKNGWIDECSAHMRPLLKKRSFEDCLKDSKKYKNISDWKKYDSASHTYARKKGWLTSLAGKLKRFPKKRTKNECKTIALKFKTKSEWSKNDPASYYYAHKKGWITHCCVHMISPPRGTHAIKLKQKENTCQTITL